MPSRSVRPSRTVLAAVAAGAALLLSPRAPAQEEPEAEAPAPAAPAPDCTLGLRASHEAVRERWRLLSRNADALAGAARPAAAASSRTVIPHYRGFVDQEVFGRLAAEGVAPAPTSSDEEFLRRVTVDLTGQIPDPETVKAFVADLQPGKRDRLVDRLLESPAFVDRWALFLGDLLGNVQQTANDGRETLYGRNAYHLYLVQALRAHKSYDQIARELIAGTGDSFAGGPPNYWVRQMAQAGPVQDTYDNLSAHSGERFLGLQLGCLSCHDGSGHTDQISISLSGLTRMDFWKNAAFFSRGVATAQTDAGTGQRKYVLSDATSGAYRLNTTSGNKSPRQPQAGVTQVDPVFILTGERPRPGEGYRAAYGRILTAHPQFARATVNYVWKELFGLGIVEPADSFDLARLDPNDPPAPPWAIQPTHPALLEKLAASFRDSGHDLRRLLSTITKSATYQRSARYDGEWSDARTPLFARHYPRRLPAEVLLDAIFRATGVPPTAAQFTVTGLGVVASAVAMPDPYEPQPGGAFRTFMTAFGRGNRDTVPRSSEGSIVQALALLDDTIVTSRVKQSVAGSTVSKVLKATQVPESITDQLYLTTLGRLPSPSERNAAATYLRSGPIGEKTEDLQFALLNRLDFLYN